MKAICPKCGKQIHRHSRKPHNRSHAKTASRRHQWITHRCPLFFSSG